METVTQKSDPDRFEIAVEGEGGGQQVAGFAAFVDHEVDGERRRVFHHTEVGVGRLRERVGPVVVLLHELHDVGADRHDRDALGAGRVEGLAHDDAGQASSLRPARSRARLSNSAA